MTTPESINAYLLPSIVEPDELRHSATVVVDVLRATTTIVHALAAGATDVRPCLDVDEARRLADQLGPDTLLGGERGGLPIDGFHLGNSPQHYTRDRVAGRSIVFTTTNGTRAMRACRQAPRILLGAFVNFSALCDELADESRIAMVCAGTDGQVTREDTLLVGALIDHLVGDRAPSTKMNDQACIALDVWRTADGEFASMTFLTELLKSSHGGKNLLSIGSVEDIEIAAEIDRLTVVPELAASDGIIRAIA